MSREAVKVVVRCRPLFGKELTEKRKPIIICDTELGTVAIQNTKNPDAKPKKFTFDAVYDPNSTQRAVYVCGACCFYSRSPLACSQRMGGRADHALHRCFLQV